VSEPKLVLPLMEGFLMGEPISDHDGVRCCPAMQEKTEEKYIVKIISIPTSGAKLEALLLAGAFSSRESALVYFRELAETAAEEAALLQKLSRLEGFSSYEGWQIEPMENGEGFDVYLLGKYRPTLERHLSRSPMTHLGAVNLGLDLCSALAVCRRSGHLYVDLKPSNIFICDDREYRIGDLGFIPQASLQYASLPEQYRSAYTPPEITDAYSALNPTMDIYAVGMILYQIYNNGQLPTLNSAGESLPAPEFADQEMAAIILKACAADPAERWQDPGQMGQALVNYMQSTGANDTPIVPPAEPVAEIPEENFADETAEADPTTDEILSEVDLALESVGVNTQEAECCSGDFAAISDDEETSSEEYDSDEEVSDEIMSMLAQADDLIAHETPEPVVAPAPIDVPVPPRIVPEQNVPEDEPTEEPVPEDLPESEDALFDEPDEADFEDEEVPSEEYAPNPRRSKKLITTLVCFIIAAAVFLGGYLYYKHIYQQTIQGLSLSGSEGYLAVTLDTDIRDDLLTVVCTDVYGNAIRQPVSQGVAVFQDLKPSTRYAIRVEISGFHKLLGKTGDSYTTATQTSIVDFAAVVGLENGSAILTFTTYGPEPDDWTVYYSAPGEAEKSLVFSGRKVNVSDLTIGKQYTFRLEPNDALYLVGDNVLEFTAANMVYPKNLIFENFVGNDLSISWDTPAGEVVDSWIVRCYSDAGYDKTITVTDTNAVFHNLDRSASYHVDVRAANMFQGSGISLGANPITVKDLSADSSDPNHLVLRWSFDGSAPEGGWQVQYKSGSMQQLQTITVSGCEATLSSLVPGEVYEILVTPVNGRACFNNTLVYTLPAAETFAGYDISAEHFQFSMCIAPDKENWTKDDIKSKDYTTAFAADQKVGFCVSLDRNPSNAPDSVTVLFVIRDAAGSILCCDSNNKEWDSLRNFAIPAMPTLIGAYTLDIYLNGQHLTNQSFTIV